MKTSIISVVRNFFIASMALSFFACTTKKEEPAAKQPNILLIVADDLGYSDIGPFGRFWLRPM